MSTQTLGNNATDLAVSGQTDVDLNVLVQECANRKTSGMTTTSFMLNNSKLFSACAAKLKSVRGLGEIRLPGDVANKLQEAIDTFINQQLCQVKRPNMSYSRAFKYRKGMNDMVIVHTAKGEEIIGFKEQRFGFTLRLTKLRDRLRKLQTANPVDDEAIASCENAIADSVIAQELLDMKIAKLEKGEAV